MGDRGEEMQQRQDWHPGCWDQDWAYMVRALLGEPPGCPWWKVFKRESDGASAGDWGKAPLQAESPYLLQEAGVGRRAERLEQRPDRAQVDPGGLGVGLEVSVVT